MCGSKVRAPCALGMMNNDHPLFQSLVLTKNLNGEIDRIAKRYSQQNPDRKDDLIQALKLEALRYCGDAKRHAEDRHQVFYGLKTRLKNEALKVSKDLSCQTRRPDNKRGRKSEVEHGDAEAKVDPNIINGQQMTLQTPTNRYAIDARYLQQSYGRHLSFSDQIIDTIDMQRVAIPFYTNCKLDNYERIHLLFDRKFRTWKSAALLGSKEEILRKWYVRTLDRYCQFDLRRKLTDKQHDEIARVKRKWKHVK